MASSSVPKSEAALETLQSLVKAQQVADTDSLRQLWYSYQVSRCEKNPSLFQQLDVTVTAERMNTLFKRYGIIVLREPRCSELRLFCGNHPLICSAGQKEYSPDERARHAHPDSLTVDCDVLMNPCIVSPWPSAGVSAYLRDERLSFMKVGGEAMPFTHALMQSKEGVDEAFALMEELLEKGGQCDTQVNTYCEEVPEFWRCYKSMYTEAEMVQAAAQRQLQLTLTIPNSVKKAREYLASYVEDGSFPNLGLRDGVFIKS